jgi:site-specific DNA-methyltransferase (adenine-specific)
MEIHLANNLEILAGLAPDLVDLVLTDPPYLTTSLAFDNIDQGTEWVDLCLRALKKTGSLVVFGPIEQQAEYLKKMRLRWVSVWVKPQGIFAPFANRPFFQSELIGVYCRTASKKLEPIYNKVRYFGGEPYKVVNKKRKNRYESVVKDTLRSGLIYQSDGERLYTNVLYGQTKNQMPVEERTEHPTQKPVNILEILIKQTTHAGGLVLDPFMGSGSTGVAALNTGREFIGIEINPHYFEIATNRLNNLVQFPEILDCINPKHNPSPNGRPKKLTLF